LREGNGVATPHLVKNKGDLLNSLLVLHLERIAHTWNEEALAGGKVVSFLVDVQSLELLNSNSPLLRVAV
jgi:hypothetical protein